ncbi:hypothetical protein ACQPZK_29735 [Micromonospora sp. CA-249363]|uniref:hypothetical protein n=1 Tax=Micromonospora sp. CA-249363 TaxID=3239963 RepID=UPI003D8F8859
MPAPVTPDARRQPLLLTVLFWGGVALAPVAALILLVADGNGPLRLAAVLAIVAVVLIGLSIALRPDGDGAAARTDELLDEIEELRRELRAEIVAAAQRGNQALDQAQRAQEGIAAIRRRLDATGAALAGGAPAAEPAAASRARVPAVESVDDTPPARSRVPLPGDTPVARVRVPAPGEAAGRVPGPATDEDAPRVRVPAPDESAGRWGRDERADDEPAYRHRAAEAPEAPAGNVYGAAARPPEHDRAREYNPPREYDRPRERDRPEPTHRPVGVVRHTETVHVTTRHTVVDGGPAESGGRYGGGYAGQWTPPAQEWTRGGGAQGRAPSWDDAQESRSAYAADDRDRRADDRSWGTQQAPRGESAPAGPREGSGWGGPERGHEEPRWTARGDEPEWTDQRDAYAPADESAWDGRAQRRGWSEQAEPERAGAPQPGPALRADDTGEYWSQLRAGDRWAAVRDDDNGRELHVGERRAEVHADATGTEYRMADRWASVRHEEARRHEDPRRHEDARRQEDPRWQDERRPELPVGGVPVPDEWRPPRQRGYEPEPAPERGGRRRVEERYGYPPQDDAPRAGGAPVTDRWR